MLPFQAAAEAEKALADAVGFFPTLAATGIAKVTGTQPLTAAEAADKLRHEPIFCIETGQRCDWPKALQAVPSRPRCCKGARRGSDAPSATPWAAFQRWSTCSAPVFSACSAISGTGRLASGSPAAAARAPPLHRLMRASCLRLRSAPVVWQVGVMGFCLGGALAVAAAQHPELVGCGRFGRGGGSTALTLCSTSQHSTSQHSIAQHSTAQRSTAARWARDAASYRGVMEALLSARAGAHRWPPPPPLL